MTETANMEHIASEELVDYFAKELAEDREGAIEIHFAECEMCAEKAKRMYSLFGAWESWTAQAHGEASLSVDLNEALNRT